MESAALPGLVIVAGLVGASVWLWNALQRHRHRELLSTAPLMLAATVAVLVVVGRADPNDRARATPTTKASSGPTTGSTTPVTTPPSVDTTSPPQPCPSTAKANAATGVSLRRLDDEACGFARTDGTMVGTGVCPTEWICTWDAGDAVLVVEGTGQTGNMYDGTWRYRPSYPSTDAVHDLCELYQKEVINAPGERVETVPGRTC